VTEAVEKALAEAETQAAGDDTLAAKNTLLPWWDEATVKPLATALTSLTAHMESKDAYRAFYEAAERGAMAVEHVPHCHLTIPRWGAVRRQLEEFRTARLLDLGCADGFMAVNYAVGHPGVEAVGVDLHPLVDVGARVATEYGVPCRFARGFLEETALGAHFDAVLLLDVLERVADVEVALKAADRHLVPGGRVYVSAPLTPVGAKGGQREQCEHVRLLDYTTFLALLSRNGRRLVHYEQLHTPDGLHHIGAYQAVG
jgi:2-polyprenyl-3-methyl-5-hydroxy-6-metoxy-1,4-benzoquinol methylase